MMNEKELSLILNTMNGDKDSFNGIVLRYGTSLLGLVFNLCGDMELAKDITQETFIKAFMSLPTIQNPVKFPSWLKQIAVNLTKGHFRKPKRDILVAEFFETEMEVMDFQSNERDVYSFFSKDELSEVISQLPSGVSDVLRLHYLEELTPAEVAYELNLTRQAIDTRLSRGREQLKQKLLQQQVDKEESSVDLYLRNLVQLVQRALEKTKIERNIAAKELAILAARSNLPRLYEDLLSHNDSTRHQAIKLIGETGDLRAEEKLLVALVKEEIPTIQAEICRTLSRIGSVKSISTIQAVVKHSPHLLLHKAANEAISVLTQRISPPNKDIPVTIDELRKAGIEKIFIKMIDDENPSIRVQAFDGLGRVESVKSLKRLLKCLQRDSEDYEKVAILGALGGILNKKRTTKNSIPKTLKTEVIKEVVKAFHHPHPGVVAEAGRSLSLMDLKESGAIVKSEFYLAIERLKHIPGPWWVTFPPMLKELADDELMGFILKTLLGEETRYKVPFCLAVKGMMNSKMEEAIKPIINAISKGIEPEILLTALLKSGSPVVFPYLIDWLKNEPTFPWRRREQQIAEGMVQLPNGKNLIKQHLLTWIDKELTVSDSTVRAVISAIAQMKDPEDLLFFENLSIHNTLSKRARNLARLAEIKLKKAMT
ncbi:sigma-70 family RNA polymerase sigma factor [Pseudoneobacillus sp. C159]